MAVCTTPWVKTARLVNPISTEITAKISKMPKYVSPAIVIHGDR